LRLLLDFKAPGRFPGPADILLLICFPEDGRKLFRNIPAPDLPGCTFIRGGVIDPVPCFPLSLFLILYGEAEGKRESFFIWPFPGISA
jgi:hypothetical protein